MKQLLYFFLLCLLSVTSVKAQNSVGINTSSPDASAALDVTSTGKGILIPRMTEDERNAISSPATGLMIYQRNNAAGFYYYNGSQWTALSGSTGSGPAIPDPSGNAGKVLSTDGSSLNWSDQAASVSLYDGAGNKLGRITAFNVSGYQILTSSGYTIQVSINGSFVVGQTFWSNPGCGGIPYINGNSAPIRNEKYLQYSARAGKLYKPSTAQDGVSTAITVSYISTEQSSGNCSASTSQSTAQGYPLTEVSLEEAGVNFNYPFALPLQSR